MSNSNLPTQNLTPSRRYSKNNPPPIDQELSSKRTRKIFKKYFKLKYFVEQYMIDLDPFKAYERCGYAIGDKDKDKQTVMKLMAKPEIQQAIYDKQQELSVRFEINQERVIKELALLAFSNMKDVASWDGTAVVFKDSDKLTKDQAAVISEVTSHEGPNTRTLKIKIYDKKGPLIDLGKHLGLFWEDSSKSRDPVDEARKIKEALNQIEERTAPKLVTKRV